MKNKYGRMFIDFWNLTNKDNRGRGGNKINFLKSFTGQILREFALLLCILFSGIVLVHKLSFYMLLELAEKLHKQTIPILNY